MDIALPEVFAMRKGFSFPFFSLLSSFEGDKCRKNKQLQCELNVKSFSTSFRPNLRKQKTKKV